MSIDQSIEYTTSGLRRALIDEINGIRNGTTSLERAKTICNLAKQVFNITKVELEGYEKKSNGGPRISLQDVLLVAPVGTGQTAGS